MKKTIKNITLIRLIQIFLLSISIITAIIAFGYRAAYQNILENDAVTISKAIKAGLTSHMKANIMEKKQYFLNEIATINNVDNITITKIEKEHSFYPPNLQAVLKTKEAYYSWDDINGKFQATLPYIATAQGTLNCLSCHDSKDGDVLGIIDLDIDITDSQELVIKYGYFLVALLMFFAFIILANMSSLIDKYISKPLSHVIDEGEQAYNTHSSLNTDAYESRELEKVAMNINDFNQDVILKENEIYKKNTELETLNEEIESTLRDTMMAMGEIEEIRSEETKNHTARVSKLSALIAKEYGLSDEDIKLIELASPLHDIGKVGITDDILQKPGKLTENEFTIMKGHAELGYRVLKHSQRKVLQAAANIAYSHHEKYNGKGYPQGLKGEQIPVFARIVAIVDVMDALLCRRIYKDAWSIEDVRALILQERGEHFEERLADIVLDKFDDYVKIIKELS